MRILLVEDNQVKRSQVAKHIAKCGNAVELTNAVDVVSAKQALSERHFDLLLLDINLPVRPDQEPDPSGGLEILRWLRGRGTAHLPSYIVGLTEFKESYELAVADSSSLIFSVIEVKVSESSWGDALVQSISDIEMRLKPPFAGDGCSHYCDILVVTALLDPELTEILALPLDFRKIDVRHDSSVYFSGVITGDRKSLHVIAVGASDKGFAGASIAATKGIFSFWPRYVYMPGITAGVRGKTSLGDVVFADLTLDWGSGKIQKKKGKEVFLPAQFQRRLDETLSSSAKQMALEEDILKESWENFDGTKPPRHPKIRVGVMASGASVLQSSDAVRKVISQHKDLLAVEMEAFPLMFSTQTSPNPRPKGVVAKAVCDFGDGQKNNRYQKFAASMSARAFLMFAERVIMKY